MSIETVAIVCEPGDWTELSMAHANVAIAMRDNRTGRVHAGQIKPDLETIHYNTIEGRGASRSFNNLSVSDGLWFRPDGEFLVTIEVFRS